MTELVFHRLPSGELKATYLGSLFELGNSLSVLLTQCPICDGHGIFNSGRTKFQRGNVAVELNLYSKQWSAMSLEDIAKEVAKRVDLVKYEISKAQVNTTYETHKVTI